jgi:hypothetical protein
LFIEDSVRIADHNHPKQSKKVYYAKIKEKGG